MTPANPDELRRLLKGFDFKKLFIERLGWDRHQARPLVVPLDGGDYTLDAVAQKRGMVVYVCAPSPDGGLPDGMIRRRIDKEVTKAAYEHIIVFTDAARATQVWQWVRRQRGKPAAFRQHTYHKDQPGDSLIQKLQAIRFTLEEEERLTQPEVPGRVRQAFDLDRITKRFYDLFKREHAAFLGFIEGITLQGDREWYASVMLNRLMFVYFIQKQGFLDSDLDYLRNRLKRVQKERGPGKFHSFYRYFLLRLFHEGLALPPNARKADLDRLLGKVPYLNGGIFELHELERLYKDDIQIPDEAFERIFAFFDAYQWHLDDRPLAADNQINPDVLGYIFEKYINQKQMGAYYTKEDITGYIARNTILPFLLDAAARKQPGAFRPDGPVWRLLRDDPDKYLYDAVRHGVDVPLPPAIQPGLADVSRRDGWNRPAATEFALPTETWREHVERRTRCHDLRRKLAAGEIHAVNDLITYNLDVCQFMEDVIDSCDDPELLRAVWHAVEKVSVLDPTCGSGAFLFAALNILEPLYEACLDRMQAFMDELDASGKPHRPEKLADFRKILQQVGDHRSRLYFIYKSIIVHNLYGVDIMKEAVEICKLRLFLKLVSQVKRADQLEPLPDIDFNIRAGNTLVGFATREEVQKSQQGTLGFAKSEVSRIDEEVEVVDRAYRKFREMQTDQAMQPSDFSENKGTLRTRLKKLTDDLNRFLANEYDVDVKDKAALDQWRASHQPLHWFAEFYGILRTGGFSVIVGNPPYVNAAKVRAEYTVLGLSTERCPDIYAWVLERVADLLSAQGRSGMIVPLSLGFSGDFNPCRQMLFEEYSENWFSSFGRIPAALFNFDVRVRNTIHMGSRPDTRRANHTSRLHRWFNEARPVLFSTLSYADFNAALWQGRIPKVNCSGLAQSFENHLSTATDSVGEITQRRATKAKLYFKKTAYNWLNFCRHLPPCYDTKGQLIPHSQFGEVFFSTEEERDLCFLLLNGKIEFSFWLATGDDFHVTNWMFGDLPINPAKLPPKAKAALKPLVIRLEKAMDAATSFKLNAGKQVGNFNLAKCRHVTDLSDAIFAKHCGFAEVWEDIELLYSQVVKTDFEAEEE